MAPPWKLLSPSDLAQLAQNLYPPTPTFLPPAYPSLLGKVVIVTGGNSGIGAETVKLLSAQGARVYVFSRTPPLNEHPHIPIDLADLTTIEPAVRTFLSCESRLDIVIHNAGVMGPPAGSVSTQGYEIQLATNALGPVALQLLLTPLMHQTSVIHETASELRIVWVSSSVHALAPENGVDMADLNTLLADPRLNYAKSKAALMIASVQWLKEFPEAALRIVSVSVDPGNLRTNIRRHMHWLVERIYCKLFTYPAVMGAYTIGYAALSPAVSLKDAGGYYVPWGRRGVIRQDIERAMWGTLGTELWAWMLAQIAQAQPIRNPESPY